MIEFIDEQTYYEVDKIIGSIDNEGYFNHYGSVDDDSILEILKINTLELEEVANEIIGLEIVGGRELKGIRGGLLYEVNAILSNGYKTRESIFYPNLQKILGINMISSKFEKLYKGKVIKFIGEFIYTGVIRNLVPISPPKYDFTEYIKKVRQNKVRYEQKSKGWEDIDGEEYMLQKGDVVRGKLLTEDYVYLGDYYLTRYADIQDEEGYKLKYSVFISMRNSSKYVLCTNPIKAFHVLKKGGDMRRYEAYTLEYVKKIGKSVKIYEELLKKGAEGVIRDEDNRLTVHFQREQVIKNIEIGYEDINETIENVYLLANLSDDSSRISKEGTKKFLREYGYLMGAIVNWRINDKYLKSKVLEVDNEELIYKYYEPVESQ